MNDIIATLNELIKISRDGQLGFQKAAEHATDPDLKTMFLEKAQGCQKAVHELQKYVVQRAGEPEEGGTVLGAMHRGWIEMKSMLTSPDDHAILAECERGEDKAKAVYEQALQQDLPADVRQVVQSHYEGVVANHDLIRDLRDNTALPE